MAFFLRPVDVIRLENSGPDSWTVYWKRNFDFLPGQVVALSIFPSGVQRLYSLATGNHAEEVGILFNLAPGGALTPLLQAVRPGHRIYVSDPFGSFVGFKGPAFWIANGTGVAPFLSMLDSGLIEDKVMIHGARTREYFLGQETFSSLLRESYVRCASADQGKGLFQGRLTTYLSSRDWIKTVPYYLCGSASMIVEARDILISRGVPFKNILSEVYF